MFDIIKKTALGLVIIGAITLVTVGYAYFVTSLNLGKTLEIVVLFTPIILYLAYFTGDIRLFNSKNNQKKW